MAIEECNSSTIPEINKFSKLSNLIRSQVYVFRFCRFPIRRGAASPDEIDEALMHIIKNVQNEAFREERQDLKNGKCVKKNSKLRKWSPFIDENSVLRMNSRLKDVTYIPFDQRFPIILPKSHDFTYLLIANFHERYYHQNHATVLNEVQQKYAIPSLRSQLKRVRHNCMKCRIRDARPEAPEMAALPKCRTAMNMRPFTFTGVDYFGPLQVKVGRRVEKKWGVIFTCLTTRGVYIDLVSSLSTDSFIMVLRIFISRRGQPREMYSDNGTNFRGSENELRKVIQNNLKEKVMEHFSEIKWHFNPPAAPHMGGAWERLVRSIKNGIRHSIHERTPSADLLRSYLAEIESIINSRPLTYVESTAGELEALTPNHFLLGSSSGVKPICNFSDDVHLLRIEWKRQQAMTKTFWNRWINDYLPTLAKRTKWYDKVDKIQVGDVVAVTIRDTPYSWQIGRIENVSKSKDGNVREVEVNTSHGILRRPVSKIAVLVREKDEVMDEVSELTNNSSLRGGVKNKN